ncbi:MAG: acetoin utilization protein AcuC [Kiritimatiellae bacterium]|nr:acetoin utilization protein AcuC [Kiritimatiellia bacterium]MDD5521960.1 acetoin utilization protein AcuC [Kiritimatiellia bacterium]
MSGKAVFLYSSELEQNSYPAECPFNSKRAGLTRKTIISMGLLSGSERSEHPPISATRQELEKFHVPAYLNALENAGKGELDANGFAMGLGTPDCPVFRGMYDYASLASGASITAANLIISGKTDIAFNPSGGYHHAGPNYAAGFCYINDIVLAALTFTRVGKRVLFLDLDVHHCDGVQAAFYRRRDVMTISLHESGKTLFPGTGFENEIGEGDGKGYSVNVPLPVGTYDSAYLKAFSEVALPLINSYNPDVFIIELGMDTLAGDPLAHLNLTNNVYAEIVSMVMKFKKPILATGGGGYNIENTVRGWALAWSVLCGDQTDDMSIGMGGMMLANTEWAGGLRDRVLLSDAGRRCVVDAEVQTVIERIRSTVFPIHGINT